MNELAGRRGAVMNEKVERVDFEDGLCIFTMEKGEEERTQSRLAVARETQVCRSIKRRQ